MALQIYNVLGREKQPFTPLTEGHVNMYVCGPTVYDDAHIGHAKTYVSFDVIIRYLRFSGLSVLYVQNITDVGHLRDDGTDPILMKARELSLGPVQSLPMQIVETYTQRYFAAMDALGVMRPDISPRASAHVPEQIAMAQQLIEKGHAYEVNGSVYFDVTSSNAYGKLSNQKLESQEAGTREEPRDEKRHPADFALWKRAEKEHIMRWDSPWGEGFPGWHIECSAMANKYLGATFDIHGGGVDNIFPHNECEIMQSEAANGVDFANYWMLVGSLMVPDAEGIPTKMSKSLGNFVPVTEALKKNPPEVIRTLILTSHYRNTLLFSDESFSGARAGWDRIMGAVTLTREKLRTAPAGDDGNAFQNVLDATREKFISVMDDDFNAPGALAALYDLTREVNALLNGNTTVGVNTLNAIDQAYRELGGDVLGIVPEHVLSGANAQREESLIRLLVDLRALARENKDFAISDRIRDEMAAAGITLEDGADGTIWRIN